MEGIDIVVVLVITAFFAYIVLSGKNKSEVTDFEISDDDIVFPDEETIVDTITAEYLESMSKTKLMEFCADRNIRIAKSWTKAKIIETILEGDMK